MAPAGPTCIARMERLPVFQRAATTVNADAHTRHHANTSPSSLFPRPRSPDSGNGGGAAPPREHSVAQRKIGPTGTPLTATILALLDRPPASSPLKAGLVVDGFIHPAASSMLSSVLIPLLFAAHVSAGFLVADPAPPAPAPSPAFVTYYRPRVHCPAGLAVAADDVQAIDIADRTVGRVVCTGRRRTDIDAEQISCAFRNSDGALLPSISHSKCAGLVAEEGTLCLPLCDEEQGRRPAGANGADAWRRHGVLLLQRVVYLLHPDGGSRCPARAGTSCILGRRQYHGEDNFTAMLRKKAEEEELRGRTRAASRVVPEALRRRFAEPEEDA
ncbi:hypothetical protein MIND_01251200 [Mycena indigotica]|uniref:Uncharacterized protein n=1 Tax=Mycena indigotica TaxID=2126181 RepID=A0A8H6S4L5_9AGAR|nr:uncharacterized protein MIND_01251200 [Mycena indigotica]KAF7292238.1 hypothetical protein MIND_01251200 [Mycena indigotica]